MDVKSNTDKVCIIGAGSSGPDFGRRGLGPAVIAASAPNGLFGLGNMTLERPSAIG